MDDRPPQILLDYTPDEILALIAEQAKIAFQAELDFFEWRADNDPAPFDAFMEKYLEWVDCSEPYADSYTRISREHPHLMQKVESIVVPIKREIFGTD
jgi:hypothetical protein